MHHGNSGGLSGRGVPFHITVKSVAVQRAGKVGILSGKWDDNLHKNTSLFIKTTK